MDICVPSVSKLLARRIISCSTFPRVEGGGGGWNIIITIREAFKKKNSVKVGTLSQLLWVPPLPTKVGSHIRKFEIFYYFIVCSKPF